MPTTHIPNYVNPETRGWALPALVIAFFVITFLVFTARIWARAVIARNAGLDDALIVFAMFPLLGLTISIVLGGTKYGFQLHTWDQTLSSATTLRKTTVAIESLYLWSSTPAKISILLFYRRMASGSLSKTFRYCVWISMASVVAYGFIFFFVLIFTCSPVEAFWMKDNPFWTAEHHFHCSNEAAEITSAAAVSMFHDVVACALPFMLVRNLQLPTRQKLAVMFIFSLGLLTCVVAVVRVYLMNHLYKKNADITWDAMPAWVWTAAEADLAIICASAPALKVFFRRYLGLSSNRSTARSYFRSGSRGASKFSKMSPSANNHDDMRGVPLNSIKVSNTTNVKVESRDDASLSSDASTHELQAGMKLNDVGGLASPTFDSRIHHSTPCTTTITSGVHQEDPWMG